MLNTGPTSSETNGFSSRTGKITATSQQSHHILGGPAMRSQKGTRVLLIHSQMGCEAFLVGVWIAEGISRALETCRIAKK